jgi:hypothetical protein
MMVRWERTNKGGEATPTLPRRILCLLGIHDWVQGRHVLYCRWCLAQPN